MSVGSVLVGLVLLLASTLVISRPWWRSRQSRPAAATPRIPLTEERDAIYETLANLDFDHSIGKVGDDDYAVVRGQLMAQAVEVLRQLDAEGADIDAKIEEMVRARRSGRASTTH
jgi:hypothetical protein